MSLRVRVHERRSRERGREKEGMRFFWWRVRAVERRARPRVEPDRHPPGSVAASAQVSPAGAEAGRRWARVVPGPEWRSPGESATLMSASPISEQTLMLQKVPLRL